MNVTMQKIAAYSCDVERMVEESDLPKQNKLIALGLYLKCLDLFSSVLGIEGLERKEETLALIVAMLAKVSIGMTEMAVQQ